VLPRDAGRALGGTFHSVGHRLIREHASSLGLDPGFGVSVEHVLVDEYQDVNGLQVEIVRNLRQTAVFVTERDLQAMATQIRETPGRPSIPREVQTAVWRRDQGVCCNCGSNESLEFDHIIPLAMGGGNTERNLQLLCEDCNRRKGVTLGGGGVAGSRRFGRRGLEDALRRPAAGLMFAGMARVIPSRCPTSQ
jgi:HNH endonuclease